MEKVTHKIQRKVHEKKLKTELKKIIANKYKLKQLKTTIPKHNYW